MTGGKKAVVGTALSLLLLWWALRGVAVDEVAREIGRADPWLLLLAILIATAGFAVRALRWRILLLPVHPGIAFRPRFAATAIGFAANNLLPARVGEFARAWSLSRLSPIGPAAAFGSLVVERILDALIVVLLLFLAMASPQFPAGRIAGIDPRTGALWLAGIMTVGGVFLFLLVTRPERTVRRVERLALRLPAGVQRPLVDALNSFLTGLAVLRSPRLFVLSLAWAVGQWLFLALSFLAGFRAFGLDEVGYTAALFLQSLIGLAVAIPSSPGFFGPFEAASRVGLGLWGIPPDRAISFAVGYHLGTFVPVTVIGLYYVWRMQLRWSDLRHSEETVEAEVEEELHLPRPGG
jgi:glycosyltransferase 2 family protein